MKATVIGGTGQLGHFIMKHLNDAGFATQAIGIGSLPEPGFMPPSTQVELADFNTCSQAEIEKIIHDSDVIIHAAGADGRALFDAPAIEGFRLANVEPFKKLLAAMKNTRATRLIILGSYYSAMHRMFPEVDIPGKSAYILSRIEQASLVFEESGPDIDVAILELPYIFGAAPNRGTLWSFIIETIQNAKEDVYVHTGGSACITMNQVGIATAHAAATFKGKCALPIGNENHSYKNIYQLFAKALGLNRHIVTKPGSYFLEKAQQQKSKLAEIGKESAYDPIGLLEIESLNLYIDPSPVMYLLNYKPEDIEAAIRESVEATLKFKGKGPGSLDVKES